MIFLAALISIVLSQGQPAPPSQGAPTVQATDLDTRLDALDKKIASIKDLAADFEQQKKSALLRKPLISSGTIKLKGPKTRWDTVRPHPTVMTIDAAEVRIYYPEQKTIEVYPVQGAMAKLAASPLPRMTIIREHFELAQIKPTEIDPKASGDLLALSLTPKTDALKEHVERIRVLIDPATACARLVEITDADGDQTTMTFSNVRIDSGLNDQDVELATPRGTSISRPLAGGKPKPEGSR